MRTNSVLADELIRKAFQYANVKTKEAPLLNIFFNGRIVFISILSMITSSAGDQTNLKEELCICI
jgi:hypothetical protein